MAGISIKGCDRISIYAFKSVEELMTIGASFVSNGTYTLVRGTDYGQIIVSPFGETMKVLNPCKFDAVKAALKGGLFSHPDPKVKEDLSPLDLRVIHHGMEQKYDTRGLTVYEYDMLVDIS